MNSGACCRLVCINYTVTFGELHFIIRGIFVVSFLQVIPETHHGTVSACLAATVENVLSAQWEKGDEGRMQYLEALVENFPLGERALRQMMPLGTHVVEIYWWF